MANPAIEILEKARAEMIAEFERKLAEVDKVIADLRASDGSPSKPANPPTVRPGQYRDIEPFEVLRAYLKERGGRVKYDQMMRDLKVGEYASHISKDRWYRHAKQVARNRRELFYDEENDEMVLRPKVPQLS